ncbi:MAG: ATP-binding cassette domain-containing protein [Ferruginibacter sp.]
MKHTGIYLHNNNNKQEIIQAVFSNRYQWELAAGGLLFNDSVIEQIIDEERRHDKFPVTTATNKTVGSMSSGEQKKAVLQYLIAQQPGFIILDDWSGNLDVQNVAALEKIITAAAAHIQIIQIFYRRGDVLPFIEQVLTVQEYKQHLQQNRADFLNNPVALQQLNLEQLPHLFEWITDCDPLVELRHVNVSYNERPILHDINWVIRPGEFWQLKGANGSGKTTLVGMIIGDNPKAYGQDIYLFGRKKGSGESVWDIKKNIGYFYPAMTLFFTRNDTVENMIISGLVDSIGLYQLPTEQQQMTAQQWLQILGPQYQRKRFNELTPGQQRIVLVIRAIVKLPPLLILDEPTAGLDDDNTAIFIQLINTLAAMKQMAIIYISHRTEEMIRPGKVLQLVKGNHGSEALVVEISPAQL